MDAGVRDQICKTLGKTVAMLVAAGWPIAELANGEWLQLSALTNGRAPSILNGALFDFPIFATLLFALLGTSYIELKMLDATQARLATGCSAAPQLLWTNFGPPLVVF